MRLKFGAVMLLAVATGANGRTALRPLNKQIKHFEPLQLSEQHLLKPPSTTFSDRRHTGSFKLPLQLFNRSIKLDLQPATHLFSDDAKVHHIAPDGTHSFEPLNHRGYFSGAIAGVPRSFAHIHVDTAGTVHGMVVEGEQGYHIEPADDHFDQDQPFRHLVYRESDVEYKKGSSEHDHHFATSTDPVEPRHAHDHEAQVSRTRRGEAVSATPYDGENNVCHMALYADKLFAAEYGVSGAVRTITQRFSTIATIWKESDFKIITKKKGAAQTQVIQLRIDKILIDEKTDTEAWVAADSKNAKPWLEQFGQQANVNNGEMDWKSYCAVSGFTYHDFEGTLGLAWVGAVDAANANGGICTGQYSSKGVKKSLNTAFTSSLNFGSKQPELQSALVFAHEVGHNFGAGHDKEVETTGTGGTFLMYPFAAKGTDANNNLFSALSRKEMGDVMGDRAGCFQKDAVLDRCGNLDKGIDENKVAEQCDCGDDANTCGATDKCCTPYNSVDKAQNCKFDSAIDAKCSPLDPVNGACCSDFGDETDGSCQIKKNTICVEHSVCKQSSKCNGAGVCNTPLDRMANGLCNQGVVDCGEGCTGLCGSGTNAGKCSGSICELWGMVPCKTVGSEACEIKCKVPSAADATCLAPTALNADSTKYPQAKTATFWDTASASDKSANAKYFTTSRKPGGATCEFIAGQPTSGLCSKADGKQECFPADKEESALDELAKEYEHAKESVNEYFNEEQGGMKRWNWLLIGGILLLICCFTTCHCTNKQKKVVIRRRSQSSIRAGGGGGNGRGQKYHG